MTSIESSWVVQAVGYVELVAYGSLSIPVLAAAHRWNRLSVPLRLLAGVPAYMLVLFTLMRVAAYWQQHNIWLAHLSVIGEALLYIGTFGLAIPRLRRWLPFLITAFLGAAALDSLVLEGLQQLNSYTIALESFLGILMVLLYFEQEVNHITATPLLKRPLIVASIGIVLYLAGTVAIYLSSNALTLANDVLGLSLLYAVNGLLLLVLSGLLTCAFRLATAAYEPEHMVAR